MQITVKDKPSAIRSWQATALEHCVSVWNCSVPRTNPSILVHVTSREKTWTAYFFELTFPCGDKYPVKVTKAVGVRPETESFPTYVPKKPEK